MFFTVAIANQQSSIFVPKNNTYQVGIHDLVMLLSMEKNAFYNVIKVKF